MRSLCYATLFALTPLAALAQSGIGQPCTFTKACDIRAAACTPLDGFTHVLDIVPETGGQDWLWVTETATLYGTLISPEGGQAMVLSFPPSFPGDGMVLVSLSQNGTVAMTYHDTETDTGDVTAITYYGTCEAAG